MDERELFKTTARWAYGEIRSFTTVLLEPHRTAWFQLGKRMVSIYGGNAPVHDRRSPLRLLGAYLAHLRDDLSQRIAHNRWPLSPLDPSSAWEWDLFWLSWIDGEILGFEAYESEGSCTGGVFAEMDAGLIERWQAAGVRTILLVGNGISLEPRHLAAAGFDVTALDVSELATAIAVNYPDHPSFFARYATDGRYGQPIPNVAARLCRDGGACRYIVGSVTQLDLVPGPFDAVIARRTIEPNRPRRFEVLDAALARLHPNGFLLLSERGIRSTLDEYVEELVQRGRKVGDGDTSGKTTVWMSSG